MRNILNILDGKKTYIVAFILAALNLAVAFDLISPANLEQLNLVLVALGLGAIRAGINKV